MIRLEDSRHFEIGGNVDEGDADISITCLRCPDWNEWIEVSTEEGATPVLLAEIIEIAELHVETCPAVYRG
jgi:hypothetical protein